MRRLIVLLLLLVLPVTACTFEFQTFPQGEEQTPIPNSSLVPVTESDKPRDAQSLEGPNINYKGIRFTLDPALGSRLHAFDETITIDAATALYTRLALTPEDHCETWCVMVYPVQKFEQAFGGVVFPPAGYRGGSAVVVKAQEKPLAFQNGSGDRSLETFGQNHYGVSNASLKYVFRGYTTDQQYAVYVQIPVRTASLPDVEPTLAEKQDVLQYNQQAVQSLNALTPGDFTPNLDLLDALVASIQVGAP
jgi:hypothetical protein